MVSLYSKLKDLDWRKLRFTYIFMVAPGVFFTLLFFLAVLLMLIISFYFYTPGFPWRPGFTPEHYIRFLTTPLYQDCVLTSLELSVITPILSMIIGYPVAWFLARTKSRVIKGIVLTIIIIPNFTNIITRTISLGFLFRDHGPVNNILIFLGIIKEPIKIMYTMLGVIIGQTYWVLPYLILILMASIQRIPLFLEEAAQSLGANKLQTFLKITFPLTIPGLMVAVLLGFVGCMGDLITPMMMSGGTVRPISYLVYYQSVMLHNYPFGSAVSITLTLFLSVITFIINRIQMKAKV